MQSRELFRTIGWVSLLAVTAKLLAVIRELIIAMYFGVSAGVDAYLVARIIPITAPLFVTHSLNLAFIPVFVDHLRKHGRHDFSTLNSLVTLWIFSSGFWTILALAKTRWLIWIMAPGFSGEQLELCITLTRAGIFSVVFSGLGSIENAVLHAEKRFALPAYALCLPNLLTVFCVAAFGKRMGVLSLMLGIVSGEALRFAIQLPHLYANGWRYALVSPRVLMKTKGGLTRAALGGTLLLVSQAYVVADRIIASSLPAGNMAALSFAQRTFSLFHGVLAVSMVTVLFPIFSEQSLMGKVHELFLLLKKSVLFLACLMLPLSLLLFVSPFPLVALLFRRGEFGVDAAWLTAGAVSRFSLQLFAASVLLLIIRVFYAIGDARTPFVIALGSLLVGISLKLYLSPTSGISGLALAASIAVNLNAIVAFCFLRKRLIGLLNAQS